MTINEKFLNDFKNVGGKLFFRPSLYRFIRDFLSIERVRKYGNQYVISTFIPPFPGKAFDRFLEMFIGDLKHPPEKYDDYSLGHQLLRVSFVIENEREFWVWKFPELYNKVYSSDNE